MYKRACYQQLDQRIILGAGIEVRELGYAVAVGCVISLIGFFIVGIIAAVIGVAVGAGVAFLFRCLHKGGPGYAFSRLYGAGLLEYLPPEIRPRYLVPLPERRNEDGSFRLSPVSGEDNVDGDEYARQFFGR